MTQNPNLPPETDEQPETVETPQPEIEPTDEPTAEPSPDVHPTPQAPATDAVDYKEKFAASTRENQILTAQLEAERSRNARRDTPATEADLQAEYPEWEYMSETEKKLARQTFTATRVATALQQKEQQREEHVRWNTDLELAIAQQPALLGKEQAFKEFASKPTHRGAPMEVLVDAFLHKAGSVPSPTPTPSAPGLEPGHGGPREPMKPKGVSADDLKTLRETDYPAYLEALKNADLTEIDL